MAFFLFVKLVLVITVYAVLRALVDANKASIFTSLVCGAGAVWFIALGLPLTRDDSYLQSGSLVLKSETSLIILMGLQLVGVTVLEVVARWLWDAVFNAKKKASKEYEIKNNQNESEGEAEDYWSENDGEAQISMQESRDLIEQEIDERAERFIAKFQGSDLNNKAPQTSAMSGRQIEPPEPPDAVRWHDAEIIFLPYYKLSDSNLPDEPMCPKLCTLSLRDNCKLRKIPSAFFTNMPLLKFLDLSETGIMSLPKSLFELPLLGELILKNCEFLMKLPPEVGKLKLLEVLDMEGTEIINLPTEIRELSILRILRVSLYGCLDHDGKSSRQSNEIISSGLISALSNLEGIYIYVKPDDERWNLCVERILNEVCGLPRLRILGFYFPRVELLSCLKSDHASMIYQSQFRLIVGCHSKRIISRLPSNAERELNTRYKYLKYINGEGVPEVIKKVLQYATTFHLDRHMTARKLTEFGIQNMDSLEYCVLGECNEMQVIIDGNDVHNRQIVRESSGARWIGFDSLKFLYIYYMKNLKSIWKGPVNKRCLYLLKSLTLSTCPQLSTIFTVGLLASFRNLEELTVRDCPAIKSLVSREEGAKQSSNYLPELMTISLHYVPELVSISSEVCIAPKLERLSLYNCPKLKSLSIKEVSSKHLKKITGETDWWEALEWKQVQRGQFDRIFVPINADTCF